MDQIQYEKVKELYSRAVSTIQVQFGLSFLVFSYYLLSRISNFNYTLTYSVLFFLTFFRYYFCKKVLIKLGSISNDSQLFKLERQFAIVSFIYSTSWAWFMIYPFFFLKVDQSQLIIFGFLSASIVASATTAMGISRQSFWGFSGPQFFSLFLVYVYQFTDFYGALLIFITLNLFIYYFYKQLKVINANWENFIQQREMQQKILDSFPGTVNLIHDHKVIFSNKQFYDLTQQTIDQDIQKLLLEQILHYQESNESNFFFEHDFKLKNHTTQTHLFKVSKLPSNQTIAVGLNIQEQKNKELKIQQQKALLDQSSKMAALGEMSGGIAHEINNPLAVISLSTQKLKKDLLHASFEKYEHQSKIENSISKIDAMISRISKIIKALRAFARDGSSDPFERTLLGQIIDDTLVFCETKFTNSDIQIIKQFDPHIELQCRPTEISQVLLNVLNNAYDAIIKSTKTPNSRILKIQTVSDNNKIKIIIQDSGDGVKNEIRDKIMQPFFTTKDIGQGTGLGLSISRSIMKSHNGDLYFDFTDNQMTSVILEFNT